MSETLGERFPWLAGQPVIDGLWPWSRPFLPAGADFAQQIARYRAAGFAHVSLTIASGQENEQDALANLGELSRLLRAADIPLARSAEAIRAYHAVGQISASFHFQSATPFSRGLDLVDAFFTAGIDRAILAYNEANIFADGCHEPRNAGLSARGAELVRRMDRVGMRVDLTHCGERTIWDVLELDLSRPPIFSHSNARAIYEHERNITDAQIRAMAEAGGYIGVNGVGFFLGVEGSAILPEIARHLAHIAGIAGADRLGLGLDFMYLEGSDYGSYHSQKGRWPRGYPTPPWSFFEPDQLGELVGELERTGFSQAEIRGILGENYLRLATPAGLAS